MLRSSYQQYLSSALGTFFSLQTNLKDRSQQPCFNSLNIVIQRKALH